MAQKNDKIVVSGNGLKLKDRIARHLPLIISLVVLAALVATSGWLYERHHQKQVLQQAAVKEASHLSNNYTRLTPAQINIKLTAVGLNYDQLKKGPINTQVITNYDQAVAAAQALMMVDQFSKSVQAYQIAVHDATGRLNYQFYDDYAYAAGAAGDQQLSMQQYANEKKAINDDPTLDAAVKADLTTKLDNMLKLKALGD